MEEIWKTITFSDDKYEVSNCGRVRHKTSLEVRKLQVRHGKNYTNLRVNKEDIFCTISKVVLATFERKPEEHEHSHHKNGDRLDDRVENLEWRTGRTNDATGETFKGVPIMVTVKSTGEKFEFSTQKEAADHFGKSKDTICRNIGNGEVNGLTITKVSFEPGKDVEKRDVVFGRKVVKVSADGRVKPDGEPWRKPDTVSRGYVRTSFQFDEDGNTKRDNRGKITSHFFDVHRLVAKAFHGLPPEGKNDCHHLDEDKLNNIPDNLQWVSRKTNMLLSYKLGFNVSANESVTYKYNIRGEFTGEVFKSASEAARSVHGAVSGVTTCCNGTRFSHKDFEWSYMAPAEYAVERVVMQARAKESNKEIVRKRREKNGPPKSTGKPIYAYDAVTFELKGSWPSGKAAAEVTKCNKANISNCVNGKLKQTGGFIFSRKDEEAFRAEREGKGDEVHE